MLTQKQIFRKLREQAAAGIEKGWTSGEYQKMMECSSSSAQRRISKGIKNGDIVQAGTKAIRTKAGATLMAPKYLFTDAGKTQNR
jgi:predicted HTH transcriptional regulator